MTKEQRATLERFADHGRAGSRYEVFGDKGNIAKQHEWLDALVALGFLAKETGANATDWYWGQRYSVTPAGLTALGRAVPVPSMAKVSLNGKRKVKA